MNLILVNLIIGLFCFHSSHYEIFPINQVADRNFSPNHSPAHLAFIFENMAKYSLYPTEVSFAHSSHEQRLILGSACLNNRSLTKIQKPHKFTYDHGAIIRGNRTRKELALVFTGDQFADGGEYIRTVLLKYQIKASFFLTGNFYRNPAFKKIIYALKSDSHYLGAHSDQHLLYCDWKDRDSLLVSREQFLVDLKDNYAIMARFGIKKSQARYFLPPYEWYNRTIADWTQQFGLTLINFSPGTKSHTDWTYPELGKNYQPSDAILESILNFEGNQPDGLNGFILLLHIGSDPRRSDKFHFKLDQLISELIQRGYQFKRIDELLD